MADRRAACRRRSTISLRSRLAELHRGVVLSMSASKGGELLLCFWPWRLREPAGEVDRPGKFSLSLKNLKVDGQQRSLGRPGSSSRRVALESSLYSQGRKTFRKRRSRHMETFTKQATFVSLATGLWRALFRSPRAVLADIESGAAFREHVREYEAMCMDGKRSPDERQSEGTMVPRDRDTTTP